MVKGATSTSVSEKSTRGEIFEAYKTLLSKLDSKKEEAPIVMEQKAVVDTAEKETVEKIIHDLSQLKLSTSQAIATLTEKLTEEAERLANLRKAVMISQQELENTQKVKITAQQLFDLIALQKEQEASFIREMEEKRTRWNEEQKAYEEGRRRERTREEEEYEYTKKQIRKRETEAWEEERQKQEKHKQESETQFASMTKELEELQKMTATFPTEKEKEIKASVDKAVAEVKKDAGVQQAFAKQEADSKLKLAETKINSLESIIKSQEMEIKELKRQAEEATRNVKEIAVSFVEGSKKEIASVIKQTQTENLR